MSRKRHWPDLNDVAVVGFIIAILRAGWKQRKREKGWTPPKKAKLLSFADGSLLEQGQKQAGELAVKAVTDGERVDGEVSVSAQGQSWAAKLWARVTARKQAKPDVSAGIDVVKKW